MPKEKPNVVLVLTDDQGYADLGCTGNPWVRTPNIDRFSQEAVRFADFHVHPLCTPTRGALLTGRRPVRNGAWSTAWGRSILHRSETTMAEIFRASGYHTGLFGKWHLGDNYPYRPFERGFERTVAHQGGGVGQTPDFWGNNYFDDTYFANGQARKYEGYCTDVWFENARRFIEECGEAPFFAYIATNAPHDPYLVADRYRKLYADNPDIPYPAFYGMITNIDENFGKLDAFLQERGLADNTILIFMTDNGSSGGARLDANGFVTKGYNAGLRGMKASYYDGGHRVPFFIRWPRRGMAGGREIGEMTLDIDVLPTLIDLCGLRPSGGKAFDGRSLAPLLDNRATELPDRIHFLNILQSSKPPVKELGCVMTRRWRLVHGKELYDIKADPGQRHDIAAEHPEVVRELRAALDVWWTEVTPEFGDVAHLPLGNAAENPTRLCAMDVMGDIAWQQAHIVAAKKSSGTWKVEIEEPGHYRFVLRRWPEELPIPIQSNVSIECAAGIVYPGAKRVNIDPCGARLRIFDQEVRAPVVQGSEEVVFEMNIAQTGKTTLDAWFVDADGGERGAYYVYAQRLSPA